MPNAPASFDVFLSYHRADQADAQALKVTLETHRLNVWLDVDELQPGQNWQPLLEEALQTARSIVVLVGASGSGPWQEEEVQAALRLAVQAKKAVIPVLLPGAPAEPELPLFLHNRTRVDLRQGWRDAEVRRIVWGVRGDKPPLIGHDGGGGCGEAHGEPHAMPAANPFDPWTPALPPRFCGREPLLRRLHHALDRNGSVSLLGDARTGKSSLLLTWAERARQAGRIVAIADGQGPEAASCGALVKALTAKPCSGAAREAAADVAADELSAWASSSGGLPPLLIIDEAEAVLARLPYRFFERVRGMLGRVCLLFATRHEIGEIARDDGRTSPLLNRLEVQRVGLLDETGVSALLARGAGVLGGDDAATLRRFAGRHPFYLSLLAHYLWQARCGGESDEAAIEAFRDNAFQRLDEWSRALPAREREALCSAGHGAPAPLVGALQRRGLLDEGQPFGAVLEEWRVLRQ